MRRSDDATSEKQKCNRKFHSEYATVFDTSTHLCQTVHIDDYDKIKADPPYCPNGHLLYAAKGAYNRWHYRHKCPDDMVDAPLSDWHAEWQSHFEHTEVTFQTVRGKGRRADAVEDCFVLEIQHSRITQEEVTQRTLDYKENGKIVLWIIDGEDVEVSSNNPNCILTFKHDWKYDRFKDVGPIYIDISGQMYQINPTEVKSLTVTASAVPKALFIQAVKEHTSPALRWQEKQQFTQGTLVVKQQGAGNGKTYGLIRMLASEENNKYSEFIYVTKQHSAKSIIYKEFKDQEKELGFTNVKENKKHDKKYVIDFTNKVGAECSLTISTIDAFMFAVGPQSKSRDVFEGILNSVVSEHIKITKNGSIAFAGNRKLNAKTLFVVDETQDLSEIYAKAVMVLMQHTNMDVCVVGDMLQSITNETNAFSYFNKQEITKADAVNICRRFTHPKLVQFVNHMTPFEHWSLPPVRPYKETDDTDNPLSTCQIPFISGKINIPACVNWIMTGVRSEVEQHNYGPENFLIVTPWVNPASSELINALEIQLQSYWIKKMKDASYRRSLKDPYWHDHDGEDYNRYFVIHRSEQGTSINLEESMYATRCVSIHSAKGDGREVVFLLDPSEFKLSCFNYKKSLTYDSLLHVAITRMKKKLFILYNNDSIGEKIKAFEGNEHCDGQPSFQIPIWCSSDLLCKCPSMFEVHKAQYSGGEITEIVDMSHHNIRVGVMQMRALRYFQKHDRHNQIFAIVNKLHRSTLKTTCCYSQDFTNELTKNNWPFFGKKPTQEEIDEWEKKKVIPYLTYPTKHFSSHSTIVGEMINSVRDKDSNATMCPMECIIEYYMYQVYNNGTKTMFTAHELYEITNTYSKSFLSSIAGHEGCSCNKHFGNVTKGSMTEYLTVHYDRMNTLKNLVDLLCEEYPNAKWNVDQRLTFSGKTQHNFDINTRISFLGYTESTVIAVYLVPNLNSMNYADYVSKAVIDRFIVQNAGGKYEGKTVKSYLLALNEGKPHMLPEFGQDDVTVGIKASMHSFFSKKHVEVRMFFNYWLTQSSDSVSAVCMQYRRMSKDSKNAPYIDTFFDIIERKYEDCDDDEERALFLKKLKGNYIVEQLDAELNRSLKRFFE
jgi:hypothetical protein